jgi:hypothetical protein
MRLSEMTFQRRRVALALVAFVLTLSCGLAAALSFRAARDWISGPTGAGVSSVAGTWHGKWHGVEAVNVRIDSRSEPVTGTVRFYRLTKTAEGFQADGHTDDLPLMNPKFDGETLSFHVSNNAPEERRRIEADIEMRLVDENRAELRRVGGVPANTSEDNRTVIEMARD